MSAIDRAFIKAYGNDELTAALPPAPANGATGRGRSYGKPMAASTTQSSMLPPSTLPVANATGSAIGSVTAQTTPPSILPAAAHSNTQSSAQPSGNALPPPMTLGAPGSGPATRATNRRSPRGSAGGAASAGNSPKVVVANPSKVMQPVNVAPPAVGNPLGGIVMPAKIAAGRTPQAPSTTSVVPSPHTSFPAVPAADVQAVVSDDPTQRPATSTRVSSANESRYRLDQRHDDRQPVAKTIAAPSAQNTSARSQQQFTSSSAQPWTAPSVLPLIAPTPLPYAAPAIKTSLAAFEVDQFAWPSGHAAISTKIPDELDQLARQLSQQSKQGVKVIAVVAALAGDGCTTLAQCLAQCASRAGLRTVLVDGNFARPALAESFGLSIDEGFEAVLSGQSQVGDVLVESLDDQLTVLPLKAPVSSDVVQNSLPLQAAAMQTLREDFDLVLIDTGAEMLANATVAGQPRRKSLPSIDAAIVVRDPRTNNRTVNSLCHILSEQQIKTLGVIDNRCPALAL